MADLASLEARIAGMGRVLLGYSGGVDSALLAVVGRRALGPDRFLAVIGRSASYPEVQYRQAIDVARRFDVPLLELATAELDDPDYRANNPDRCYFCKRELWTRLGAVAAARGFDVVIDGTNADDLGDHRPGARAAGELAVRSPLVELGWTKAMVREASAALELPTWDAPAAPCLASRLRYGVTVTAERLRQVEDAEAYLRALGIEGNLRVRHLGTAARVEADPAQFALLDRRWSEIERFFAGLGFERAERDPQGYRRGSLLAVLGQDAPAG